MRRVSLEPEALERHGSFLRALARGLLRDEQEAEDVVQEAFATALGKPSPLHPRAWLAGVVRNLSKGVLRGRKRRGRRERAVARSVAREGTDQVAERVEVQRRLAEEVARLPEPGRTVVVLRYFEGQSAATIAERLDVTPKTVRVHLRRSLARLRGALQEAFGGSALAGALFAIAGWSRPARAATGISVALVAGTAAAVAFVLYVLLSYDDEPPPVRIAGDPPPSSVPPASPPSPPSRTQIPPSAPSAPLDPNPGPDPTPKPASKAGNLSAPPAKPAAPNKKPVAGLDNTPQRDLPSRGYRIGWPNQIALSTSRRFYFVARRRGREIVVEYELGRREPAALPDGFAFEQMRSRLDGTPIGTGVVNQLPWRTYVLDDGSGALMIERYSHMGYGRSLAWIDRRGVLSWTRSLAELFTKSERSRFPDLDSQVLWLAHWWVDEPRRRVILLSSKEDWLAVDVDTGAIERVDAVVLCSLIAEGRPEARIRALEAAGPRKPAGYREAVREVVADETAPFAVRVHAAVVALYDGGPPPPAALFERARADAGLKPVYEKHRARIEGGDSHRAVLDRLRGTAKEAEAARKKLRATWGRSVLVPLERMAANPDEENLTRARAAYTRTLLEADPDIERKIGKDAVAVLREGLLDKSRDEMLGRWSADRLAALGKQGGVALAALAEDPHAPFEPRRFSIVTLGRATDEATLESIYRVIGDRDQLFAMLALRSLDARKQKGYGKRLGLLLEAGVPHDGLIAEFLAGNPSKDAIAGLLAAMDRHAANVPERERWMRIHKFVYALNHITGKRFGDDPVAWRKALQR